MRLNILVGLVFIGIAIVLAMLSWRGVFKEPWLDRADKIASVVSLLIALGSFFLPLGNNAAPGANPSITFGDNAQGNTVGQSGTGNVTIGDTTTSAKDRADAGLKIINQELLNNFTYLGVTIQALQARPPAAFWDTRRPNETELAYQERAKNEFRSYQQEIEQYLREIQRKYSKSAYTSQHVNLAYYPDQTQRLQSTYGYLDETIDSVARFASGLQHLSTLNLKDADRAAQSRSLHQEKLAEARTQIAAAAAQFCLVMSQDVDAQILSDALQTAGIQVRLEPGTKGYQAATRLAAQFAQEKAQILESRLQASSAANLRQIDKRIDDPYLLMLRRASGLSETLTDAEVRKLESTQLQLDEQDPAELFKYAAFAYLESDGRASAAYYQRALDLNTLSELQALFARTSIDRLDHPDRYDGSIGLLIAKLTAGGNFERSGLAVGDVIVAVDGTIVNEPYDIASALGKSQSDRVLLTIVRGEEKLILPVSSHESAGALVTQLIILNAVQL